MTRPLMRYPDAALVMTVWLRGAVAAYPGGVPSYATGVQFCTKLTAGIEPGVNVRIRRSGGTVQPYLRDDSPRLDFQVRHPGSDREREQLAELVRGLVYSAQGSYVDDAVLSDPTTIGQVTEFVGPGAFTDPENTAREIILFTMEVRLRGVNA